ncbi:hypothetical protein [Latilactobacillus curvatus]|uniref:hypothetical protein n=1 Tax=Latilactobacillus curvatus TaxID=28038 RepID=UPI000AE98FD4|nr:hypothetical protein [Latilactobacillus curvatus]
MIALGFLISVRINYRICHYKEKLLELFTKLEDKYVATLVKDIQLDSQSALVVSFTDEKFKDYAKIKVLVDDQPVAEVKNGTSNGGQLDDNVLTIPNQADAHVVTVVAELPHKFYILKMISQDILLLKCQVEALFETNDQLKPEVTQDLLD